MLPAQFTRSCDNDCLGTTYVTSMKINIPEVKVSCFMVKPKGRITVVRFLNNSSCPTTIAKGITLALCHRIPVHCVLEVSEELEQNENEGETQMTYSQLQLPDLELNFGKC